MVVAVLVGLAQDTPRAAVGLVRQIDVTTATAISVVIAVLGFVTWVR